MKGYKIIYINEGKKLKTFIEGKYIFGVIQTFIENFEYNDVVSIKRKTKEI